MRRAILLSSGSFAALAISAAVAAQSETRDHTYDPLGQLVITKVTGGQNDDDTRTICYDEAGNRLDFKVRQDGTVPACAPLPPPPPPPPPPGGPPPPPPPPPSNNPPVTQDDSLYVACGSSSTINLTVNDSDPDGDPLTLISITKNSGFASAVIVSASSVNVSAPTQNDTSQFTYTVSDGNGGTATGLLTTSTFCGFP